MKKNLLFKRLSSCKVPVLALLLAICTCYTAFAQNKQITGKVTSADDGSSLPGVSVRLKGTNLGSVTDVNGVFKISAANGSVITFSYIGYDSKDVTVGAATTYNVSLSPNARSLAEVNVVSIGYGTQKRTDLSGSIASVSGATLDKLPSTTLETALQGRAAGVQVTNNDGAPGGNVSVLIRGTGSLASYGNGPLYIIDGFPLDNGNLNNINPNDIASIDVLKDASATAIYGIRAANGVVIVTTKKGKNGTVQVSVDGYEAFQSKPKLYKVLNAQQFATLANSVAADPTQSFSSNPAWTNPASLHTADFQNAVYGTGLTQSYTLAFRGGSDKIQQATSFGYYNQRGIVDGSYFKRATFATGADYQPIKWLRSSTNVKYTFQDSRTSLQTGNGILDLAALVPTLDGGNKYTNDIKSPNPGGGYNYGFYNPTYSRQNGSGGNPLFGIDNNRQYNLNYFLLANTSLEATIFDGLKFKTNVGINTSNFAGQFYGPADNRISDQYPGQGQGIANYNQNINQTFDWLLENTLSYDKTFGKHSISFLAGASEQKTIWAGMGGGGVPPNGVLQDLTTVGNFNLNKHDPNIPDSGNGTTITALQSYFGRLNYDYDNRYILTVTVRRDGSSKFATGQQFGTFPAAAVAWKAKNESFLKTVDWLSDLKFRGSWGRTGSQGSIAPFQYAALYQGPFGPEQGDNLGYPFNKIYTTGIAAYQPAANLKWETDTSEDVGLDAAFLHGDLTLTADWYDRKSKDFLLKLQASSQTGFTQLTKNLGSIENKGVEFSLNYHHKANSDFTYGASLNIAANKNVLTSVNPAIGVTQVQNFGGLGLPTLQGWTPFSLTNVGQPIGEFYGFKSLGIFQTQAQVDALNQKAVARYGAGTFYQHSGTIVGDRYFADTNGDGIVNDNDRISLGSPQPKFYGGLNLDATYKAWDFNLYFYGTYGNKIFSFAESNIQDFESRQNVSIENVSLDYYNNYFKIDPITHAVIRASNTYSRVVANDDAEGSYAASSAWIENGSFLKLKTATVGYTLPSAIAKKVSLTKLRVYVSSQNLFTITSYKGLDPEIGTQGGNATQNGIDNGAYPSSRFFTVGLSATL